MSRETYYFSKKLTASTSQQTYELPRLRSVNVLNFANQDVLIEFENDIGADSIILPVRGNIKIPSDMLDLRYKVNSGTTATIYIYGLKHDKS